MAKQATPPPPPSAKLRQLWQRWGSAFVIAVAVHAALGTGLVVLYYATRPPPPRYVVVDLLPPRAGPTPTASATATTD